MKRNIFNQPPRSWEQLGHKERTGGGKSKGNG